MHCARRENFRMDKRCSLTSGTQENTAFQGHATKFFRKDGQDAQQRDTFPKLSGEGSEKASWESDPEAFLEENSPWLFKYSLQSSPLIGWHYKYWTPILIISILLKNTEALWDFICPYITKQKMNKFKSGLCVLIQPWLYCFRHHELWPMSGFLFFFPPDNDIFLPRSGSRLECIWKF